jgi:uncharacterized protein YqeY
MLLEQIEQDFKQALKDKNQVAVSSLRNLKAEIKNAEIEKKKTLTDDEVLAVLRKKVKQHKDSIEGFKSGGREDLVAHEQSQMEVLQNYLPAQMDEAKVTELVKVVISEMSAKQSDFGKVMKEVLARAGGQTDGSVVSKIVKQELSA